jgi:hypothetical protein
MLLSVAIAVLMGMPVTGQVILAVAVHTGLLGRKRS